MKAQVPYAFNPSLDINHFDDLEFICRRIQINSYLERH